MLIDLVRNGDEYSASVKKIIIQEMMANYLPKKLISVKNN